jgi:hypothetical protein
VTATPVDPTPEDLPIEEIEVGTDEEPDVETPDYDAVDVPAALERETADGPGFESEDELPPSDCSA